MDLKAWRAKHNLTISQAAKRLGLSQPVLSRIESGQLWISAERLQQIVDRSLGEVDVTALHRSWTEAAAKKRTALSLTCTVCSRAFTARAHRKYCSKDCSEQSALEKAEKIAAREKLRAEKAKAKKIADREKAKKRAQREKQRAKAGARRQMSEAA